MESSPRGQARPVDARGHSRAASRANSAGCLKSTSFRGHSLISSRILGCTAPAVSARRWLTRSKLWVEREAKGFPFTGQVQHKLVHHFPEKQVENQFCNRLFQHIYSLGMVRCGGHPQFLFSTGHSRVVDCLQAERCQFSFLSYRLSFHVYLNIVPMVAKQIVRESGGEERVSNVHRDDVRRGVLHRHLDVCLAKSSFGKILQRI